MWRFLRVLRPEWFEWFASPPPPVFQIGDRVQLKGKPHIYGEVWDNPQEGSTRYYPVKPWNRTQLELWKFDEIERWHSICSNSWRFHHHMTTRKFTYWFPLELTLMMLQMTVVTAAVLIGAAKYEQMKTEIEAATLRAVVCETLNGR